MFARNISDQASHWDKQWTERTINGLKMNVDKMSYIINEISKRPHYSKATILDIGCGSGIHAAIMASKYPSWSANWFGIDLSSKAVETARSFGLNAKVSNIYSFESDLKFDAFLFLDVLEHIEDYTRLAKKIMSLANERYFIFGNIPLYSTSDHSNGGCEKSIGREELAQFLAMCGAKGFWQKIYGSFGFPYMIFEAVI